MIGAPVSASVAKISSQEDRSTRAAQTALTGVALS
jgi:hypothetical protein